MTLEERVIEEAFNLKKYATPEELRRLNIENLNPLSVYECIYGQMTGSCNSKRALELIQKCCSEGYKSNESEEVVPTAECNYYEGRIYLSFWSPIEKFIWEHRNYEPEGRNKKLVRFLQGKRKTLKF